MSQSAPASSQGDQVKQAVREHEARWDERLRKVAKQRPPEKPE